MRCARVPPPLALGLLLHGVVYLTNSDAAAVDAAAAHAPSSSTTPYRGQRLRFEHLPAPLLASALRQCRAFVPEGASYTIASSGDASRLVVRDSRDNKGGGVPIHSGPPAMVRDNVVLLHVVQRQHNDFVPNNRIYHSMQRNYFLHTEEQQPSVGHSVGPSVSGAGRDGCVESPASPAIPPTPSPFAIWLRSLQSDSDGGGITQQPLAAGSGAACSSAHRSSLPYVPATPLVLPEHLVADAVRSARESENLSVWLHRPPASSGPFTSSHTASVFHFYPYTNSVDSSVAYATKWFVVLVNLKPVTPGHLLIVPKRIVYGIHALNEEEVEEWGVVLRKTVDVLRALHCSNGGAEDEGFSIAIQHGRESGQTVWHQHTHVMPFKSSSRLAGEPEEGDEEDHAKVPPRTPQEMRAEAVELRSLFYGA